MHKLVSLLYVSRAVHPLPKGPRSIDDLVAESLARNHDRDITGALIYTGAHFAQVLEGPAEAVEDLMQSIRQDGRHRNVEVLVMESIAERRFPDWKLAYAGPSLFVDRRIAPLVDRQVLGDDHKQMAERLIALMVEFVSGERLPG